MMESYVLGHRLVRLLSTLLPRHPDYYSTSPAAMRARADSQEQLVKVLRYLDQIAILIDKEEHSNFVGTVLGQKKKTTNNDSSSTSSESSNDGAEDHHHHHHVSSNASTLKDLMETQRRTDSCSSNIKIKVTQSLGGSGGGEGDNDLGFSMMILASSESSDRSAATEDDDDDQVESSAYAGEPLQDPLPDTSWMTNSILLYQYDEEEENESSHPMMPAAAGPMMIHMAPPNPLIRTGRTIVKQEASIEKSLEDEICFHTSGSPTTVTMARAATTAATTTSPTTARSSSRRSETTMGKLDWHLLAPPQVVLPSSPSRSPPHPDPHSVGGYLSATSGEHQNISSSFSSAVVAKSGENSNNTNSNNMRTTSAERRIDHSRPIVVPVVGFV
jgi:hypothetical protein